MISSSQGCILDGKLPFCLYELYSDYKKGTRTIIEWLVAHGSVHGANRSWIVTVRDLVQLADNVKMRSIEVPITVASTLRDTIEARAQLSHYFTRSSATQTDLPADSSHEFFTSSLKGIYEKLCKSRRKVSVGAVQSKQCEECKIVSSNRYGMLESCLQMTSVLEKTVEFEEEQQTTDSGPPPHVSMIEKGSPRIADDDLGEAIEILRCLQEMQDLCSAAKQSWENTANGSNPLVVAALITNVAFTIVHEIDSRLCSILGNADPEILFVRYTALLASLSALPQQSENVSPCLGCAFGEDLRRPWQILLNFKHDLQKDQGDIPNFQKPMDYIMSLTDNRLEAEQISWKMILQSMVRLIASARDRGPTDIMWLCSPFVDEIRGFLLADGATQGIKCAFGLRVLLEGFKGHLWSLGPAPNKINCRVEALRFTEDVIASIGSVLDDSTMPCRCPHTLASFLERYRSDLLAYTRERAFDLYTQAPWVSGSHMLEILDMNFYYGLRLCSYKNVVASVLHVYNVLVKFGNLQKVQLFEGLSEMFLDVIFLGERPSRNFASCLMRFMGGRIRFNNAHSRRTHSSQHSCTWDMEMPRAPNFQGKGLRKELSDERFKYEKFSLFHQIKGANYTLDDELWAQVFGAKRGKKASRKEKLEVRKKLDRATTADHPLHQVEQEILKDFEGDFPVAKINLFEVYLACANIVSRVSDDIHGAKGDHCLCFVETLLKAADQYQANRHMLKPFPQPHMLRVTEKAFQDVLEDRPLFEFLWRF
ncbi:MAG: hypothetical protein M1812_000742 [Candelaria pacifica]|nr:MAG: hypothetical protein M1812_000742 [Candelaria pacifica]